MREELDILYLGKDLKVMGNWYKGALSPVFRLEMIHDYDHLENKEVDVTHKYQSVDIEWEVENQYANTVENGILELI